MVEELINDGSFSAAEVSVTTIEVMMMTMIEVMMTMIEVRMTKIEVTVTTIEVMMTKGVFDGRAGGTSVPPNCRALNLVRPSIQKKITTEMAKMKKNKERNPFFLVARAM